MADLIKIKDLTFRYPHQNVPVFSGLSLDIPEGGIYGLLGPNGAGKSTLLYCIAGLLNPITGQVELYGKNTRLRQPSTLSKLFLVPEEFELPRMTLAQYADIYSKYYPQFSYDDMKAHLQTFNLDTSLRLGEISMGQKKKAFMCFSLAANTPLLMMDEPTNGLDIPGKMAFRSFMAQTASPDRSIIISTHQVRDVSTILDHVIIMDQHSVLLNASMQKIASRLKFEITNDPALIATALYKIPTPQGMSIVTVNNDGIETLVDLELLFQLVTEVPQSLDILQ